MRQRKFPWDSRLHNPRGPAVRHTTGKWVWMLHGEAHRYYGPQHSGGSWYLNGFKVK